MGHFPGYEGLTLLLLWLQMWLKIIFPGFPSKFLKDHFGKGLIF